VAVLEQSHHAPRVQGRPADDRNEPRLESVAASHHWLCSGHQRGRGQMRFTPNNPARPCLPANSRFCFRPALPPGLATRSLPIRRARGHHRKTGRWDGLLAIRAGICRGEFLFSPACPVKAVSCSMAELASGAPTGELAWARPPVEGPHSTGFYELRHCRRLRMDQRTFAPTRLPLDWRSFGYFRRFAADEPCL